MNAVRVFVAVVCIVSGMVVSADELLMKNGSRLIGTLVSAENGSVKFKTPFAGELKIKLKNIEQIVTDKDVTVMMEDGLIHRDIPMASVESQLLSGMSFDNPIPVLPGDIKLINPEPWKLGDGYKWSGNLDAALESERGNSDNDEWELEGETVLRSLLDRYSFSGQVELKETNGNETKEQWDATLQYDRFTCYFCPRVHPQERRANPKNYFGLKVRFEHDKFADLDLRTLISPHVGRQLFDSKLLTLEMEVGPVWVDEKFNEAEDNEFPGALWTIDVSSNVLGFGTTLYMKHSSILNFDATSDLLSNTTTGIRFPLLYGLQTSFEAEWEYDGGAVEDVDSLDETYNFRIGYAW